MREQYRFLFRSASALTGSRAVAEDVVQDCFTNAWKHRDQLRDPELARAWLFQIMRRGAFRQMAPGIQPVADEDLPEQAAPESNFDDRLDVVKALARIAPIHREVFVNAHENCFNRHAAPYPIRAKSCSITSLTWR